MSARNKSKSIRKNKRGRTPFSARLGILITVLVLIVAAAGVLMAPGLIVTEVYCEGNVNLKSEDIITAAQIQNGKNIFLTYIGKAKRNVEKISMVKSVKVQRVFPNRICISIQEREPIAYVQVGSDVAVIDSEKIVVKTEKDSAAAKIVSEYTPKFRDEAQSDGDNKESEPKRSDNNTDNKNGSENVNTNSDKDEASSAEDATDNTENNQNQTNDAEQIAEDVLMKIPLVTGIEFSVAEEGKKIKCNDDNKFDKTISICVALKNSDLLSKTTYIDISDTANIRLVVENRLDVKLGDANNIDYRTKFMAEVINNKISAYEVAIIDYTGDDIYVRPRDDGKERVLEQKKTSDKTAAQDGSQNTSASSDNQTSSNSNESKSVSNNSESAGSEKQNIEGESAGTRSVGSVKNIDDET